MIPTSVCGKKWENGVLYGMNEWGANICYTISAKRD